METERETKVYPILVVCALIVRDGNILLEKCATGKWDLPGGKVECGETPYNALIREIKEELAIEIEPYSLLETLWPSNWNGSHWVLAVYRANIISGNLNLTESLKWIPIQSLTREMMMNPDYDIVRTSMAGR